MKKVLSLLAFLLSALAFAEMPKGFIDDYEKALELAKAEHKLVFADFTGSDWCFWCQRLDSEILSQEDFLKAATNKFVLLMIDSPRDKSILSEKAKAQNRPLARRYKVSQYPTVLLLDEEGKIVGETGFVGGGVENYLKVLDEKVAAIPHFLEWVKPYDKRLSEFYRRMNDGMKEATKLGSSADEGRRLLEYAEELTKIIAEERAKEVPESIAAVRSSRIKASEESARSMREFAIKKIGKR